VRRDLKLKIHLESMYAESRPCFVVLCKRKAKLNKMPEHAQAKDTSRTECYETQARTHATISLICVQAGDDQAD